MLSWTRQLHIICARYVLSSPIILSYPLPYLYLPPSPFLHHSLLPPLFSPSFPFSCPPPSPLQGKSTELLRDREVKQAKEKGCQVVSPHWLLQCQEKGYRQLETDYPMTFNPSMALVSPHRYLFRNHLCMSVCLYFVCLSVGCANAVVPNAA